MTTQEAVYETGIEHTRLFLGFEPRECGEHRTVGDHRAWCYADSEWCYPSAPCRGCEIVQLREQLAAKP